MNNIMTFLEIDHLYSLGESTKGHGNNERPIYGVRSSQNSDKIYSAEWYCSLRKISSPQLNYSRNVLNS